MTQNRTKRKTVAQLVGAAILLGVTLSVVQNFLHQIETNEVAQIDSNLQAMSHSNVQAVQYTFGQYISGLQATAATLSTYTDYASPNVLGLLDSIAKAEGYEYLAVDFVSGNSYTSNGVILDIRSQSYLGRIQSREIFICNTAASAINGKPLINIFVPLPMRRGQKAASLRLAISVEALRETLQKTFYYAQGYYLITDEAGNPVSAVHTLDSHLASKNWFENLEQLNYEPGYYAAEVRRAFQAQNSGFLRYTYNSEARYAYYEPVGLGNWMMLTILPKEMALKQERYQIHMAGQMALQLCGILLVVFVYFLGEQRRSQKIALLNDRCFREVSQQTNKIIFEWDYYRGQLSQTTHFSNVFGREAVTKYSANEALDSGMVHPDDAEAFKSIFAALHEGQNLTDLRFRVQDAQGQYQWCSLSGIVVKDSRGHPYRAIGYMDNIQNQMTREEGLKRRAEHDALTGLYNKVTTEALIRQTLELDPDEAHALFIIDVDNFKGVNDKMGHLYGDMVLTRLAKALRPLFRAEDIVGRVGGDEFFVFLKHLPSPTLAESKAQDICQAFRNLVDDNGAYCQVSASVGIALFPQHGPSLDALYKNADEALYTAKARGKDGFCLYTLPPKP